MKKYFILLLILVFSSVVVLTQKKSSKKSKPKVESPKKNKDAINNSGNISTKAHRLHLRTLIDNFLKEIKG